MKKLYKVTLRGMTTSSSGVAYGISYVSAENPTEAYEKVKTFLDKEDLGFCRDRELDKVELIADSARYPNCGTLFFV